MNPKGTSLFFLLKKPHISVDNTLFDYSLNMNNYDLQWFSHHPVTVEIYESSHLHSPVGDVFGIWYLVVITAMT